MPRTSEGARWLHCHAASEAEGKRWKNLSAVWSVGASEAKNEGSGGGRSQIVSDPGQKASQACQVEGTVQGPRGRGEGKTESREEGWTQKVEGGAEMEIEETAGRPPGKAKSMTSFPSLINQITANHDITLLIFGRSVFFMYKIG